LAAHIANYKRFRSLIHSGTYWRRSIDEDHAAVCVTSQTEALALVVRTGSAALGRGAVLKIAGLEPDATYRIEAVAPVAKSADAALTLPLTLSGRVLAGRGLPLYLPRPETSLLLHVSCLHQQGAR
jgi:alpha-galactosidase